MCRSTDMFFVFVVMFLFARTNMMQQIEETNRNEENFDDEDQDQMDDVYFFHYECDSFHNAISGIYIPKIKCERGMLCCGTCNNRYCCADNDYTLNQKECVVEYQLVYGGDQVTNEHSLGLKWCDAFYDEKGQYSPKRMCTDSTQHCSGTCTNRQCSSYEKQLDQSICPQEQDEPEFCDFYNDEDGTYQPKYYCLLKQFCSGSCQKRFCASEPAVRLNQTECILSTESQVDYMEEVTTSAPLTSKFSSTIKMHDIRKPRLISFFRRYVGSNLTTYQEAIVLFCAIKMIMIIL